jgi:hypothetical protein
MKFRTYVGGILIKFLAVLLVIVGLIMSVYSETLSQQTGVPTGLWWISSWVIFLAGLIVFATSVFIQRRALYRLKTGN